jgi:hypothetical protein
LVIVADAREPPNIGGHTVCRGSPSRRAEQPSCLNEATAILGLTTGYCPKKKEKAQMAARIDLKDAIKGNALPTGRGIKVLHGLRQLQFGWHVWRRPNAT